MATATQATRRLESLGIAFERLTYDYDSTESDIGGQAARALGIPPDAMFKTLMIDAEGRSYCAVLPVTRSLSLPALARQVGAKRAALAARDAAERQTGYRIGGISPIAQKRPCPVLVDSALLALDQAYLNGGKRGLVIRLAPQDLLRATEGVTAAICKD